MGKKGFDIQIRWPWAKKVVSEADYNAVLAKLQEVLNQRNLARAIGGDIQTLLSEDIHPPLTATLERVKAVLAELTESEHDTKLGNELKRILSGLTQTELNLLEVVAEARRLAELGAELADA